MLLIFTWFYRRLIFNLYFRKFELLGFINGSFASFIRIKDLLVFLILSFVINEWIVLSPVRFKPWILLSRIRFIRTVIIFCVKNIRLCNSFLPIYAVNGINVKLVFEIINSWRLVLFMDNIHNVFCFVDLRFRQMLRTHFLFALNG